MVSKKVEKDEYIEANVYYIYYDEDEETWIMKIYNEKFASPN